MADPTTLSALTSMQPGTVEAYGGILKTIISMNPVLGGVITLIGAFFVNRSTKKIQTAEDAKGPTPEDLAKFKKDLKAELDKASGEALVKFEVMGKTFAERIEKSGKETVQGLDQAKIKAMRLSDNVDAKLSKSKTIEDAMEQRVSRLEKVHAEFVLRMQRREKK